MRVLVVLLVLSVSAAPNTIGFHCGPTQSVPSPGGPPVVFNCPGLNAGPGFQIDSAALKVRADLISSSPGGAASFAILPGFAPPIPGVLNGVFPVFQEFEFGLLLAGPSSGVATFSAVATANSFAGSAQSVNFTASVDYEVSPYDPNGILFPSFGHAATGFTFINVRSGGKFDPPFTSGYEYTGLSGTLFSAITLPTGFGSFTILAGPGFGTIAGSFNGGDTVTFGTPQSAFRVTGINPLVDAADPAGFPLTIFFTDDSG
jgi:hypothetical protein